MITGAHHRQIPIICLVLLGLLSCGEFLSKDVVAPRQGVVEFLNLNDSFFITQSDAGGVNEEGDQFGADVFPGDLNGDGFEDVVVGSPGKGLGSGAVARFPGSEAGATVGGLPIARVSEAGDQFGAALTTGDFDGDKIEDLAVGAPGRDGSGAVFIFFGLPDGGFEPVPQPLTQSDAGEMNEAGDEFGAALATGDFDNDGTDELVVGAPGKAVDTGAVFIFSRAAGVFTLADSLLTKADAAAGDRFGASLESAHFNGSLGVDFGDRFADLAVGAPGKNQRSGAVYVFLGSGAGFAPGFSITQTDALGAAGCAPRSCVPGANEAGDLFGEALGVGDLNGDGVEELIVGAPGEDGESGAVFIFPGSPKEGGRPTTGYYITQGHAGQANEAGDRFGAALAAGVLNEDDFEELVVGAPGKGTGSGAAIVFPGVAGETGTLRGFLITQTDAGGLNEAGDRFGAALAIEDFNDNNGADLAVGAPGDAKSGAVFIFPGVPTSPPAITEENACPVVGGISARPCEVSEEDDKFGTAVAAGDFDGDGFVDLAVGAPGKAPGEGPQSGAVFIFPGSGSPSGITTGFFITQTDAGEVNEAGDRFGTAVAAGDFNHDGFVDLAVGAPGEGLGSGAVFVFPGSVKGLTCLAGFPCPTTITTGFFITQNHATGGVHEAGDEFGAALAVGDFDGDGIEDLAVGAPGDGQGAVKAGSAFVFPGADGSKAGLTTGFRITQNHATGGVNEAGDRFGAAVAAGNIVGDAFPELLVGAPGDAPDGGPKAGSVFVFSDGSQAGFATGFPIAQTDALGSAGCAPGSCVQGVNEAGDGFGAALAVGDFDGDGVRALAVGAPGDALGAPGATKAGSVFIFPAPEQGDIVGFYITHENQIDPEEVLPNEDGDEFGAALAVGDFNGDRFDELLVGATMKASGTTSGINNKSGTVSVFPGSETGLCLFPEDPCSATVTTAFFTQKGRGGANDGEDQFGAALAVGDFNGDLLEDLAVAAPGEALGANPPKSGAVFVVPAGEIEFILRP